MVKFINDQKTKSFNVQFIESQILEGNRLFVEIHS